MGIIEVWKPVTVELGSLLVPVEEIGVIGVIRVMIVTLEVT
jgi:hypothetical protein